MKNRAEELNGFTTELKTGLGKARLTVNEQDGIPFEVFITMGKSGGTITAKAEAIGRLISLALRHDATIEEIVKQLIDISDDQPLYVGKKIIKSLPDAIAQELKKRYLKK